MFSRSFSRSKRPAHAKPCHRRHFRPLLELLEDRALLTAGTLDKTFGTGGTVVTDFGGNDEATDVAMQPADDKIVVAGSTDSGGGGYNFAVARYNPNGSLDTSFSFDGNVATDFMGGNDFAEAVAVQKDGKIVVAGYAESSSSPDGYFALARYNGSDGTLDTSFGTNGKVVTDLGENSRIEAMTIMDDGRILVTGESGGNIALARYMPDGSVDPSFGITKTVFGTNVLAGDIAVQKKDGDIVVVGTVGNELAVLRYNSSGLLDPSFGTSGHVFTEVVPGDINAGNCVALQNDGSILVGGAAYGGGPDQGFLVRYLSDGTLDSNFDADGKATFSNLDFVWDLAIQSDGRIVAAGMHLENQTEFAVLRCYPDGSLDSTFGTGGETTTSFAGPAIATAMTLQADGKIVAAGQANGTDFAVARYNAAFSVFNISKIGNLLLILGTDANDQLVIQDDGPGGVMLISPNERTDPFTIQGIGQIAVQTRGGDDDVHYEFMRASRAADTSSGLPADVASGDAVDAVMSVSVDLGSGDDTFLQDGDADFVLTDQFRVAVSGGDGNDNIAVNCAFNPQPDPPASPTALNAPLLVGVDGGRGDDEISVICGFNPQLDPPARGINFNTPIAVNASGGPGNDDIRVIYGFNPQPDSPAFPVNLNAPISSTINGGPGNDNIADIFSFNPQPDPPAMPPLVAINAPVTLTVNGGLGGDSIEARVGFNPQPDPPASPIAVNLLGGAGADNISFTYQGLLNDELKLRIDGGEGIDVVSAKLFINAASTGALDARVVGGGGSDALTLDVYFVNPDGSMTGNGHGRLSSFTAIADGGAGHDLGSFTANVLVRSVEGRLGS